MSDVLSGKESLELALLKDALRVVLDKNAEVALPQDYDPVLRAHCRYDNEA